MVEANTMQLWIKIIKLTLYIILFGLSLILTSGVILNYLSRDSSLKQSQIPISVKPVITICFSPRNLGNLTYGQNFSISKYNNYFDYYKDRKHGNHTLKVGENPNEQVKLSIITTGFSGECYQIHSTTNKIVKGAYEVIVVHNLTDKISMETLKSIKVYYTSEKNALGILNAYWLDGDILDFEIDRDESLEIGIKEIETVYLQEKSACSTAGSFYECYLPKLLKKDFETCPQKCLPFILDTTLNTSTPNCPINSEAFDCAKDYMLTYLLNVSNTGICSQSCTINEYTGKITFKRE